MSPFRTSDLSKLLAGEKFNWGDVIAMHAIGPYAIAEYHPWKTAGSSVLTGNADMESLAFAGWVEGRCTSQSWLSLDAALAGCMAYRAEGRNCRAGEYFIKMIQP